MVEDQHTAEREHCANVPRDTHWFGMVWVVCCVILRLHRAIVPLEPQLIGHK